jgi:hypothetical protein
MPHPVLARRIAYPLHEQLMKRPTFAYVESLERTQYLARGEIERLQMAKLKAMLQLALQHCPWHAQRIRSAGLDGMTEATELTLGDLRRIPTMTKQDATIHGESIHWPGVPGAKASTGRVSRGAPFDTARVAPAARRFCSTTAVGGRRPMRPGGSARAGGGVWTSVIARSTSGALRSSSQRPTVSRRFATDC